MAQRARKTRTSGSRSRKNRPLLRVESLEARQLLAVGADLDLLTGQLRIEGTSQGDYARVEYGQKIEVSAGVSRTVADTSIIRVRLQSENQGNSIDKSFAAKSVKSVRFEGQGGTDYFSNTTTLVSSWGTKGKGVVNTSLLVGSPGYTDTTAAERVGIFTVGESGQVGFDYLFRGAGYTGQLGVFSLKGMDKYTPGSADYNKEAARRALSSSDQGYVVIKADQQGAKYTATLPWEGNFNKNNYKGVTNVKMTPGDTFGLILIPDGTMQKAFDDPKATGSLRPLYSLPGANGYGTDSQLRGQVGDLDGSGSLFAFEDLRLTGSSDRDYNDMVFQVLGARGEATPVAEVVNTSRNFIATTLFTQQIQPYTAAQQKASTSGVVADYGAGTFRVGASGVVQVDNLRDGLSQDGEIAIFSLDGMAGLKPGSDAFFREAARRALSDSKLGHVVVSDQFESPRSVDAKGKPSDKPYEAVQSFAMNPGDTFAILYVSKSSVWDVYNAPGGSARQHTVFSIAAANKDGASHIASMGSVAGQSDSFVIGLDAYAGKPNYLDAVIQLSGGQAAGPAITNIASPLPATSIIRGIAYDDSDGDGKVGNNELSKPGINVTLTGTDALGLPVSRTTITGTGGVFSFEGLPSGSYRLASVDRAGASLDGWGQALNLGGTAELGGVSGIKLGDGQVANGYALGRLRPATISGSVFGDLDRDRVFDPSEAGLAGVEVTLVGKDTLGAPVTAKVKTDASGRYVFEGLRPGRYQVKKSSKPDGWFEGREALGSFKGRNKAIDRNGSITSDGAFVDIDIRPDEFGRDYNFGQWATLPTGWSNTKTITLRGTKGDDTFVAVRGAKTTQIWVNGVLTEFDSSANVLVTFDGLGGNDKATITGGAAAENFITRTYSATFVAPTLRLEIDRVADYSFKGGAGDRVYLYDSPGDDVFRAGTTSQTLEGPEFRSVVTGAERVYALARAGGQDSAFFTDSTGDDNFRASPIEAAAYGAGYYVNAKGFSKVSAVSNGKGVDRATLTDSAGDDIFRADPTSARLTGDGFDLFVQGYGRVIATASEGGFDQAYHTGSANDDKFEINPQEARFSGAGFENRSLGFDQTFADGAGGNDKAYITASQGDDTLKASPGTAWLKGPEFETTANGFSWIRVIGSFGTLSNDVATITASAGNDVLEAEPDSIRLTGSGYSIRVEGFSVVDVNGNGGNDRAAFKDSTGDDLLEASPGHARMTGRWFDNRATGFGTITVDASRGGLDRAMLTDSAGDALLSASLSLLTLNGSGGSLSLTGFEEITADALSGGKNRKAVESGIQYLLELRGDWTEDGPLS